MPDFSRRSTGREIMDDLMIDGPDLHRALRELDSINYALGGNYVTLNGLLQILSRSANQELHIVDVGCGSGDMLRRIRALLERRDIKAELTGVDANPNVIRFAKTHTPAKCRIHFETLDIFSEEFSKKMFDLMTGTLFFHHFTDDELIHFFSGARKQVRYGLIINDIHRHWLAYYAIKWLTRWFSRSAMVQHDAPLSVLRGFRKHELQQILNKAGIHDYKIRWLWAFRWQVIVPGTGPIESFAEGKP